MFEAADYRSALFEQFVQNVERLGTAYRILDLGPATPTGLNFWTHRGLSLSVHDRVTQPRRRSALDFGAPDLAGALCWNALAMMDRQEARDVVAALRARLVPGGVLFAIFDGDGRTVPTPLLYTVRDERRLRLEPREQEQRPRAVSTAEIEDLLRDFKPTRVTVMRHGSREALGHVPLRASGSSGSST